MVSTSGHTLLSEDAIDTLRDALLPLATVVTPNIPEAEILAEQPKGSIKTVEDMKACAKAIAQRGSKHVLLKGGHMPFARDHRNGRSSPSSSSGKVIVDVLYSAGDASFQIFERDAVDSPNTHGTGCTLSAAICTQLAKGRSVYEAVETAGNYVRGAIAASYKIGSGAGPVNHLHTLVHRNLSA